jgi:predicted phosphoribosyltransferase
MADVFVCLDIPEYFMAVGEYYEDFKQVTDADVTELLREFRKRAA